MTKLTDDRFHLLPRDFQIPKVADLVTMLPANPRTLPQILIRDYLSILPPGRGRQKLSPETLESMRVLIRDTKLTVHKKLRNESPT